jgi:SAM-dependent methyltransferase
MPWDLACPSCHAALKVTHSDERRCAACAITYRRRDGIWRFLVAGRERVFERFVVEYETVRSAEGRRVQNPSHLRALPFRDLSRQRRYEWSIRARSFETLITNVVEPRERTLGRALRVLDMGSGLGWLAYRLALRRNEVAAVDLVTNDFDGLGVWRHYDREFLPVQAEFDRLPFSDRTVDIVVYNASFHYAVDFASTLREALRVLGPSGRVVIMDTPIYRDASSGRAMVREREKAFETRYGFRGNALASEGFLTYERLDLLERELTVRWRLSEPWYGLRWWGKPWVARLRGSREPARFGLIVGQRACES